MNRSFVFFALMITLVTANPRTGEAAAQRVEFTQGITRLPPNNRFGIATVIRYSVPYPSSGVEEILLLEKNNVSPGNSIETKITINNGGKRVELSVISSASCVERQIQFYAIGERLVIAESYGISEPGRDTRADAKRQTIRFYEPKKNMGDAGESDTYYDKSYEGVTETFACSLAQVDRAIQTVANRLYR